MGKNSVSITLVGRFIESSVWLHMTLFNADHRVVIEYRSNPKGILDDVICILHITLLGTILNFRNYSVNIEIKGESHEKPF